MHGWQKLVMLMEEFEVGGKDASLVIGQKACKILKERQIMVSRSLQYKQNYVYIVTPFVLVGYLL